MTQSETNVFPNFTIPADILLFRRAPHRLTARAHRRRSFLLLRCGKLVIHFPKQPVQKRPVLQFFHHQHFPGAGIGRLVGNCGQKGQRRPDRLHQQPVITDIRGDLSPVIQDIFPIIPRYVTTSSPDSWSNI